MMAASRGVPSRAASADPTDPCPPNHCGTDRLPAINIHMIGTQRAEDTLELRSRSKKKSASMTRAQTSVATLGGIYHSPNIEHRTEARDRFELDPVAFTFDELDNSGDGSQPKRS